MSAQENYAYKQALELAAGSKNEAALIAFDEALRQQPDNFRAAFGAALVLQRLNRHADAIARFSCVIETNASLAEAYYSRALSLQILNRHDEALTDIGHALDIQPENAHALSAQGASLKALGRCTEAMQAYSAAVGLSPLYLPALHGRATIKKMLGDHEGAVIDFGVCIANGLDSYDVRLLRGLSFHYLGRHQEAITDLSRAISLRPEEGSTYIRRWQVYISLGDKDSAAKDFEIGTRLLQSPLVNNPTGKESGRGQG